VLSWQGRSDPAGYVERFAGDDGSMSTIWSKRCSLASRSSWSGSTCSSSRWTTGGTGNRYHHLFADVLQAHLQQERPGEVAELHRRAGGWFERAGK
jgi:hypothetical protein